MGSDFESAVENLEKLIEWAAQNVTETTRNEATTRLHLIDRLLFECLGWNREDCIAEEQYEGQYTDYSLGSPSRKLVVEAKKEGLHFELPAGFDKLRCRLRTLLELDSNTNAAIRQAVDYCQKRGIPIGAVCNGRQLIAFIGSRQDGVAPLDGHALVFSSLAVMRDKLGNSGTTCLSRVSPPITSTQLCSRMPPKPRLNSSRTESSDTPASRTAIRFKQSYARWVSCLLRISGVFVNWKMISLKSAMPQVAHCRSTQRSAVRFSKRDTPWPCRRSCRFRRYSLRERKTELRRI